MSTPAQVTNAHLALARDMAAQGQYLSHSIQYYSQLIANSEAREVALHRHIATQLAAVLNAAGAPEFANADHASQWAKEISGLTAERDQLRAELALLREWQREVIQNANAHHAERKDAIARAESAEREAFDWKKIARYETARAERAEAEVERLKSDGAASAFITMSCRASRAETDRNNLRADLDAIKSILNEEKGRAERAEAELAFQVARNSDLFTQRDGAVEAQEKAEAELDAERAKAADQGLTLASLCDGILGEDHADRSDQTLIRIGCGMKKELAASRYETVKAAQEGLRECIRAERAEAELATERARLDWLMAGGVCMVQHTGGFHVSRLHAQVSRAAIDAAMKEGGK